MDAIAARLHAEGVRAGDRVGVLLPRSPDLVAALLATWRVGVVYVPLDAAFPRQRLAFMAEDATTGVVVTSRSLLDLAAGLPGARPLVLDDLSEQAGASLAGVVAARASGSAYIMYTSGSTGHPRASRLDIAA